MVEGGQLRVLSALDDARTSWYHATAVVIAGMGFFTDAYDLFSVNTVSKLLGRIYYPDYTKPKPNILPVSVNAAVNGVALCGTVAGQIFFGWAGDRLGRKKVYGITLIMMIVASLGSGLSFGSRSGAVITTLCFFRFWLGFGIGGDYPLSATIMSEYANRQTRGAFIAAVFAMQGFGILTASIVTMVLTAIVRTTTHETRYVDNAEASVSWQADYVWRAVFMFGAIPAAATFYWRMQMPETARYTALIEGNAKKAAADMAKVMNVHMIADQEQLDKVRQRAGSYSVLSMEFVRRHGLRLLGTTSTWLLLDIAFYSQTLFQKDLFSDVGWIKPSNQMSALEEVMSIAKAQATIAIVAAVPGYWVTVLLIDRLGRFKIQLQGFLFMTLFLFIVGLHFEELRGTKCSTGKNGFCGGHPNLFLGFYALTFFFANFGPNSTTFIVPAELFPARLRSTCHGISAAAGKLGAIIGTFGFISLSQGKDPKSGDVDAGYKPGIGAGNALVVLACVNALGFAFTFLVPETKGLSLEEISGEYDDSNKSLCLPVSRTRHVRGASSPDKSNETNDHIETV